MADSLRRFVARSPRYVLRPSDNQMLRFAPKKVHDRSFSTRFVNISESGLAFLIDRESAPQIGEFIKIEFPVPGGEQIAWFAKVVRLEEFSSTPWWSERDTNTDIGVVVGVQFHELPQGHRQAIRVHLQEKFHEMVREQRLRVFHRVGAVWNEYGWQFILYLISAALTFGLLYWLSRPDFNYDEKRGAPWGQRFKLGE